MLFKLNVFILQLTKNTVMTTACLMFFANTGWDKLLKVVPIIAWGYVLTFPARVMFEEMVLNKTIADILSASDNSYSEYAKSETRAKKEAMENDPLTVGKRIYLLLKRDMLLATFSIVALPLAPQMYTIMQNIPVLHTLYPKDSESTISRRAAMPYKQDDSSAGTALFYLLKQSLVAIIIPLLVVLMGRFGVTERSYNVLPPTILAVIAVIFVIGTLYNTKFYLKWTKKRLEVALTTSVKVVDTKDKEKREESL